MMSRAILLWTFLATVSGIGLFIVADRVQMLEAELARTNREVLQEEEAIHVLRAEWSYLNEPSRLAALVARHLDMQPPSSAQRLRIEDVPLRLPIGLADAIAPDGAGEAQ
jgi:cell division protein FtsL